MEHQDLAEASAALGAIGAPLVLLARERFTLLAGVVVVVAAEAGLAYALVPDAFQLVTESALRVALVLALALGVLALAVGLVRFPAAAPVVLLAAAPFRLSVGLGSQEASLLLPLYVALAAATAALVYRTLRGQPTTPVPLLVALPASAFVGLAAISLVWARDLRAGLIELVFFFVPFAVLLAVVARTRPERWTGRALATALLSLTAVIATIGLYEAATHDQLVGKHTVTFANAFASYFRVTSLFKDPSVFGRHVVLGMVVLLALLWLQRLRPAVGLPLMALSATALYFSYSQTSFLALFAAVLVVGLVAGDVRTRRILAATAAALALVGGIVVLATVDGEPSNRFTRGRSTLVRITLPVYADHPVAGVGIGSQPLVSGQEADGRPGKHRNASHTTPLTIAAELGTLGLLAYTAFLLGTGRALLLTWRRDRALGLALIGCLTSLVVHSLTYGAFFEDPFVWGMVGLAAAALAFLPEGATESRRPEKWAVRPPAKPFPAQPPGSPGR
jgi:O-antigen ligase/polysaccharide polymerase Wzy-like membrane protein